MLSHQRASQSFVVGVNKPTGMTSHDVVSACRRMFGERRVGHAGTLDPMASGVLPIMVGTATRLSPYLMGHDKRYRASIVFGSATDTDDAAGKPIKSIPTPPEVATRGFAESVLQRFTGTLMQMPPLYSALKHDGKKACDEARRGNVVHLEPREITVFESGLLDIHIIDDNIVWDVEFHVSKGTYIRSLARDIGRACGGAAHLGSLERTQVGSLELAQCARLETLEAIKSEAALDPVRLLGYRIAFADDDMARLVSHGAPLEIDDVNFFIYPSRMGRYEACQCTSGLMRCDTLLADKEMVSVALANELLALYSWDEQTARFKAKCVFDGGVQRGRGA